MIASILQEIKDLFAKLRELGPKGLLLLLREQPRYWYRILRHTYRLFMDNRGPYQANALAYRSMLSMVPMAVFVVSLSAWIFGDKVDVHTTRLKSILKEYVVPKSVDSMDGLPEILRPRNGDTTHASWPPTDGDTIGANPAPLPGDTAQGNGAYKKTDIVDDVWVYVEKFKDEAEGGTRGGFLILLLTSVFLINGIEVIFNNLWHIKRRRPFAQRVLAYTSMTVLIPLLFGLSIFMTAYVQVLTIEQHMRDNVVLKHIPLFNLTWGLTKDIGIPILMVWVLVLCMYKWLPNTKVETRSALIGGLVAAIAFETCKWSFSFFSAKMVVTRQLYWGPIGIFIVFLLWVYVVWFIILFCAQLTYVFQNYRYVLKTNADPQGRFGNAYLSCRIMLEIAARHHHGQSVPTVRELAQQLKVEVPRIQAVLASLTDANLVILGTASDKRGDYEEVYVPGRDLGAITVSEVVKTVTDAWRLPPTTVSEATPDEANEAAEASPAEDGQPDAIDYELELTQLLVGSRDAMEAGLGISFRDLLEKQSPTTPLT